MELLPPGVSLIPTGSRLPADLTEVDAIMVNPRAIRNLSNLARRARWLLGSFGRITLLGHWGRSSPVGRVVGLKSPSGKREQQPGETHRSSNAVRRPANDQSVRL